MTKFLFNSKINFSLNKICVPENNLIIQKPDNYNVKNIKCNLLKVVFTITSHEPISTKFILNLAEDMNVNITSFINLKKKDTTLITVLSGPHIDKKSRDQFCISKYSKIFIIDFTNILFLNEEQRLKNFLLLKKKILDYAFNISFTYFERENIKL